MSLRQSLRFIGSGFLLCTGLLSAVQAADLKYVAYIPADANVNSIRFEKARMVQIPIGSPITSNSNYCAQAAAREPGGSAFCPSVHYDSKLTALDVTYSYEGQPAPWDETRQTRFEFHVLYRPSAISFRLQRSLSARKQSRSEIAEYFSVKAHRETVLRRVVDEAESSFCDGNFVEASWTASNSGCTNKVSWKTVAAPSPWITVSVDPTPGVLSVMAGS